MYRPIPTTHEHHRNAVAAFQASFLWAAELFEQLFPSVRAATAWLRRYERQGYFASARLQVSLIEAPSEPIYVYDGGSFPNEHKLAYQLERRWKNAVVKRLRVFWPTTQFATSYSKPWAGTHRLPAIHKASHDLLLSSIWLGQLEHAPDVALNAWTSERELEYRHRRGEHTGPIPDALVNGRDAIEVGGQYPAKFIRKKIEQCIRAGYRWQLW